MRRGRERALRAGFLRHRAEHSHRVGATRRARRDRAGRVQLDVRGQVGRIAERVAGAFAFFQGELVGRRVNLAEVIDTGIQLGLRTGFHEVRDRDSRQEADDGHDDHDFNQRETRFADVLISFHLFVFLLMRGGTTQQAGYIIATLFT